MDSVTGYADVNDTRLYYEIAGHGPAIVLIHGFALDTRMWDEQFEALISDYRVLRYDMRGFGKSSMPADEPYDPCADLAALMTMLNIDQAVIVGLSLGGWVAIDFVLAYPKRSLALVAADAAIMGFDWPNGRPSTKPAEVAQRDGIETAKQYWLASELFKPAAKHPRLLRRLGEMLDDYTGWHWVNDNQQLMADEPAIDCLDRIRCPCLVIIGEHDSADFHAIANIIYRGVTKSQLVEIPSVGHMSNMEDPQAFNQALKELLENIAE